MTDAFAYHTVTNSLDSQKFPYRWACLGTVEPAPPSHHNNPRRRFYEMKITPDHAPFTAAWLSRTSTRIGWL